MGRGKGKCMCFHFLVLIIQIFDTVLSCPASIPTISYVSYCPTNQEEWEKAAERKNCESIAVIQNCTDRSRFQYHCLMNHWKNATLEVCAPIFYLQGYCAEYNIQMLQVAEIYDEGFECLKFNDKHKCPLRYPSNEAYKYQGCYRYQNKISPKVEDNSWIALVFILIALLLFGILVFVVVMMKKGICHKHNNDDTEEETDLLTTEGKAGVKPPRPPAPSKRVPSENAKTKLPKQKQKTYKDRKTPPPRPANIPKTPANQ